MTVLSKFVHVRLLRREDADSIVDLYKTVGWKLSKEHVAKWIKYSGKYSRILVAELNGKIVGKVTLDTAFPPYAEIVNIIVHPGYQKMGVGSKLIKECIKIATDSGHNIIYLMCDPANREIHRFYAQLGFIPGILGDPKKDRGNMWLYYFSKNSFVNNFLEDHPFSELHVSKGKVNFHGSTFYSMKWCDPLTEDVLEIFIKGQPGQPESGGTMPRISGLKCKLGEVEFDCWIQEENNTISPDTHGKFRLNIMNKGGKETSICIKPLPLRGVKLTSETLTHLKIDVNECIESRFKLELLKNFNIPLKYLTFPTITVTLTLKINNNLKAAVSAGFEHTEP